MFITIHNFSKSFGPHKVIRDLNFEVNQGEIFAFLGANGSGKTTTLRCLLGIYTADEGELLIDGEKYDSSRTQILGYLPEERGLYVNSKVLETMIYFGELKGLSVSAARKFSLDYLDKVGLADKYDAKIKQLSSGQQQKIQLGITIINSPKLLILDEPTKGLDPVNRDLLMDILDELNSQGTTILFSSHQMEEVEKIADRLVMIKDGTRKLYGQLNQVKSQFADNKLELVVEGDFPVNQKLYSFEKIKNKVIVTPNSGVGSNQVLQYLVDSKVQINSFNQFSPSLHEIFVKVSNQHD